jgi:ribose-phosphate pyrophosphokinase
MEAREPELVFGLSESQPLVDAICAAARCDRAPLEERSFERGEFKLRPQASVRDRDVTVIQTLADDGERPTAERFVRLLFLLAGLRDAGAARRCAVVPYLSYARKDRRTQPRDPVNTRYVAQLLEAVGLDRLVVIDVHNSAALDNAFRIPVDHLSMAPMFAAHLAQAAPDAPWAIASPDVGGIKRAQVFRAHLARRLGRDVELAFVGKQRVAGQVLGDTLVGDVQGRHVVLLDDLCATGGTLERAAAAARRSGAPRVFVAVSHAPLAVGLERLLAAPAIDQVIVSDSVGGALRQDTAAAAGKLTVLPCAALLGAVLARRRDGRPLAPLLEDWPPGDDRLPLMPR